MLQNNNEHCVKKLTIPKQFVRKLWIVKASFSVKLTFMIC